MHSDTITIFNFYESSTAAIWYPHVLSGGAFGDGPGADHETIRP